MKVNLLNGGCCMILSFCGHASFSATEALEKCLLKFLDGVIGQEPAFFYLGGYGAFDEFAYATCKKYKETHPNVRLVYITPYITEEYQKKVLALETKRYDEIIYPEIENKPLRFAISYRNQWMMEKADIVIAFVAHDWGGAYKSYQYAKRKGKRIFNLANTEP